jgi:hypothetical protein
MCAGEMAAGLPLRSRLLLPDASLLLPDASLFLPDASDALDASSHSSWSLLADFTGRLLVQFA